MRSPQSASHDHRFSADSSKHDGSSTQSSIDHGCKLNSGLKSGRQLTPLSTAHGKPRIVPRREPCPYLECAQSIDKTARPLGRLANLQAGSIPAVFIGARLSARMPHGHLTDSAGDPASGSRVAVIRRPAEVLGHSTKGQSAHPTGSRICHMTKNLCRARRNVKPNFHQRLKGICTNREKLSRRT